MYFENNIPKWFAHFEHISFKVFNKVLTSKGEPCLKGLNYSVHYKSE